MKRVLFALAGCFFLFSCLSSNPPQKTEVASVPANVPVESKKPAEGTAVPPVKAPPETVTPEELARRAYEAKIQKVNDLLDSGSTTEAIGILKDMNDEFPSRKELKTLYASVLMSSGDLKTSRTVLDGAIKADPMDANAVFAMAVLESASGNAAGQKKYLDQTLKINPTHSDALTAYGEIYFNMESYSRAAEFFKKSIESDPGLPEAHIGLGRVLFQDHKWDEAEAKFRTATNLDPKEPEAWAELGRALFQKGEYERALEALDKAIAIAPQHGWYYYERAQVYLSRNKRDDAVTDFTKCIALQPDYFLPYIFRAGIYEDRGDDDLALADYRDAVALYPDYYYAFESIGVLSYKSGQWEESRNAFLKAAEFDPEQYEYPLLAAISFLKENKRKESKEIVSKALSRIDKEKKPLEYTITRMYYDFPGVNTMDSEQKILQEKKLDRKALAYFFLAEYWALAGKKDLALKYYVEIDGMKREGSFADRLAKIGYARLKQ